MSVTLIVFPSVVTAILFCAAAVLSPFFTVLRVKGVFGVVADTSTHSPQFEQYFFPSSLASPIGLCPNGVFASTASCCSCVNVALNSEYPFSDPSNSHPLVQTIAAPSVHVAGLNS